MRRSATSCSPTATSPAVPMSATAIIVPTTTATPASPITIPNPNTVTRMGTTRVPADSATDCEVSITPPSRPRYSSGTTRWKIVVRVTSRTRLPVEITAIARKATVSSLAMPRTTVAAPNAAAPNSSTRPSCGRSTSAAESNAPTVPPTPSATFR